MTTFTASEVREQARKEQDCLIHNPTYDMLRAYADRLEADEKAKPVGQTLRDEDGHEWPAFLNIRDTKLHDDMGGLGQHIYTTAGCGYKTMKYVRQDATNPLPAAERLAEVLEIIDGWMELYDHQGTGSSRDASRSEKEWAADRAKLVALLGAQAQSE